MTDETPLSASGPEREIFLRALRRMSEECEAPNLIAECPFSIDLPGGGRGCLAECEDILDAHGVPPPAEEVPLGSSGINARPRRRRRPQRQIPVSTRRPFDAAELYYNDSEKPHRDWSVVSLLYHFSQRLLSSPANASPAQRLDSLMDCAAELERHGIAVESLVRYGLDGLVANAIAQSLVLADIVAAGRVRRGFGPPIPTAAPGWSDLLAAVIEVDSLEIPDPPPNASDEEKRAGTRLMYAVRGDFFKYTRYWIRTAPLVDVLSWKAPELSDFQDERALTTRPPAERRRVQRWIYDRFVQTYLGDWASDSLNLEWRFIQGQQEAPCSAETMAVRSVDEAELLRMMASRTVARARRDDRVEGLKRTAARFLSEGQRSAAVAVCVAARDLSPDNPEVYNNYGFCLVPDQPEEALRALEQAGEMGYRDTVNIGNRMFALTLLGRDAAALALADRVVEDWKTQNKRRNSWMWDFNSTDEPVLLTGVCPTCYVLDLAVKIAEKSGDSVLHARWQKRRDELSSEE